MEPALIWQAAGVLLALMALWSGVMLWAAKFWLTGFAARLDQRFDSLALERRKESSRVQQIADELRDLQVTLPRDYVRREDWIRFGGAIDAKLDAIWREMQNTRDTLYDRTGSGKGPA